jgi:hypothetical protein
VPGDLAGEPDRSKSDERREQEHHQAQTVDPEGEVDVPIAADRIRGHHLETALAAFESEISQERGSKSETGGPQRGSPWRRAQQNGERGRDREKNDKEQDHRKIVK